MRYLIIIEKSENGYCAYSPDIAGCIAAGETEEETRVLMKDAITFHLEGLAEDGDMMPIPQTIAEYVEIAA